MAVTHLRILIILRLHFIRMRPKVLNFSQIQAIVLICLTILGCRGITAIQRLRKLFQIIDVMIQTLLLLEKVELSEVAILWALSISLDLIIFDFFGQIVRAGQLVAADEHFQLLLLVPRGWLGLLE